jgi:acetolactate synthase regulatory subunit
VKSDPRQARKVETSASLALGTKPENVQSVADDVVATTDRHRGFVVTSSTQVSPDGGGASFELRIPSERLKPALADLSRLADVRERREATQDITAQFVSARTRLADARAERTGLLRQLAKATTDAERASVKARLRSVGARIATAKTDLARVNNRASYSTIAVSIIGDPSAGAAPEEGSSSWTPGDAADDALRVLEVAAGIALIALAIGVPLAILAALALLLTRLTQRRRRERLLDAI